MENEASELRIVPLKPGKCAQRDPVEGRGSRTSEWLEGTMSETQGSVDISLRLQQIARVAQQRPQQVLTTLAHHIDVDFLREAYRQVRKDGAVGVDGQSAQMYAERLEENLVSLHERLKSGSYRAPAVRRVHIPKGSGAQMRPIGIPTFEDKVLQKAVTWVLEAVYERDFLDCSYGFRPGRSAHQAVQQLWESTMKVGGGWVLDVDIQGFFDALDPRILRGFLDQRVRDGVLRRVIHKWLKAGVMENGQWHRPKTGTPQGGVISPLLANLYLHHVMDAWFEDEVRPRLYGSGYLIRYADDFVIVLTRHEDVERVMVALGKRLGRFGLTLHPDKTRVVPFEPPRGGDGGKRSQRPVTFDFLGFTHYWGKSRKNRWIVKRKTARDRFGRARKQVEAWVRQNRHLPVAEQHRRICLMIRGHCAYYGITGNAQCLRSFVREVGRVWQKWLDRRSRRGHMPWERFNRLLERYPLPTARVVHSVYRS